MKLMNLHILKKFKFYGLNISCSYIYLTETIFNQTNKEYSIRYIKKNEDIIDYD